jgi:hypothetical protein
MDISSAGGLLIVVCMFTMPRDAQIFLFAGTTFKFKFHLLIIMICTGRLCLLNSLYNCNHFFKFKLSASESRVLIDHT